MESTLIGLIVSAVVPKLLELLKSKRWAPFIQPYAPVLNTVTAGGVALLTALGVSVDFDSARGVLTVSGLLPGQLLQTGMTWLLYWVTQEGVYRVAINRPSAVPPSRLYLLPLLFAIGASSCASATGALVTADKAVYEAISRTQDTVDRLCDAKVMPAPDCQKFNTALVPAIDAADSFNRAVRANSTAEIPVMVSSLTRLGNAVVALLPDEAQRADLAARIEYAKGLLQSIWGK